jgi:hypothetical protein
MLGALKALVKKLRSKSRDAYRSGWQDNMPNQIDSNSITNNVVYSSPTVTSWTSFATAQTGTGISIQGQGVTTPQPPYDTSEKYGDKRIVKKPVEVVQEIVKEEPVLMLDGIEQQIKIVQKRIRILEEQNCGVNDEKEALGYLKARAKYKKSRKDFKWAISNNDMIEKLQKKYKVQLCSFASYVKCVPNEALDELEKYLNAYHKIRKDDPELKLITDYQGPEHRRDPILLARSPFGRWWYVLGAWDKEVEIVDDLIIKGK